MIEKLERESDRLHKLSVDFSHDTRLRLINEALGIYRAIAIVKKHQGESVWVSVDERLPTENDGRVSWGVNAYKKYILVNIVSRGIAMTCRFNLTDKCFETADKVTHWMSLPQPPSEVQP